MKIDDSERGGERERPLQCLKYIGSRPTNPPLSFPLLTPTFPPQKNIKEKGGNVRYNRSPVPPAEKKGTSGKVYQK